MSQREDLEKQLAAARAATAAKLAEKKGPEEERRLLRELAFEKAKVTALETYLPEQLLEPDVAAVGPCLLHWPNEISYNHFMKTSGAIRGDLSKMSVETTEDLLSRCAIFPDAATLLKELRANNPHARSVISGKLLERMKGRLDEEGK